MTEHGRSTSVKFDSPLRYPGGKAALAPFIAEIIALNGISQCVYFEPFAGGAGAALRLLRQDVVSRIHINDLDPCVYAFWQAALGEPHRFAEAVASATLNIAEWTRQREIYSRKDASKLFELGFSTFYLNRCNRSGLLFGSGPIGGYDQQGKWKLDARFNREGLADRVMKLGERAEQIHVSNMDACQFLVESLPRGDRRRRVFAYLDPPYWNKGSRLYFNSYLPKHHSALARYIQRQKMLKWVMSYDDAQSIRGMYGRSSIRHLPIQYNLQQVRSAHELLIAPKYLHLPAGDEAKGEKHERRSEL